MQRVFDWMRANWGWIASFTAAVLGMVKWTSAKTKAQKDEIDALKAGVQALLRAQMIDNYNHYSEKGFAPLYARENFENLWVQYEKLGKNGVMQDIRSKFLALPTHDDKNE